MLMHTSAASQEVEVDDLEAVALITFAATLCAFPWTHPVPGRISGTSFFAGEAEAAVLSNDPTNKVSHSPPN